MMKKVVETSIAVIMVMANLKVLASGSQLLMPASYPVSGLSEHMEFSRPLVGAIHESRLFPLPDGVGGPAGKIGYSVSVDGNRALVGGPGLSGAGVAVVFENQVGKWIRTAVLRPSNGRTGDNFGTSVSLQGNRAVIGAPTAHHGDNAGAVYVFEFDGEGWTETSILLGGDVEQYGEFGHAVSLSGARILAGAPGAFLAAGSAYIFELEGDTWVQIEKLTADSPSNRSRFGSAVSLDEDRALIGARPQF